MKHFLFIAFAFIGLALTVNGFCQDSSYARRIDSLWLHSYNPRLLSKKRAKTGNAKVEYVFHKDSGKMNCIVSLNKAQKENLIFFYLEDKAVMIWPSGQEPYYILNDRLVYGKELKHTTEQIQELVARAYNYLDQGYKRAKGRGDGGR
jgi:hypothetical protein